MMVVEAIKKGDGYFIPLKGKKEKIKVIIEDDTKEAIIEHYEEKRKREIKLSIDDKLLKEFIEKNNLTTDEENFWESLR